MKQLLLILTILAGSVQMMVAQNFENPVTWTFRSEKVSDTEYDLYFKAKVDAGWHVYSQDIEPGGPIPTGFEFETLEGASIDEDVKEEGKLVSERSDIFGMDLNYYKKEATFIQRIKLNSDKAKVAGYLTYMTCNDRTCLPPTDVDFAFTMERSTTAPEETPVAPTKPSPETEIEKEETPVIPETSTNPEIEIPETNLFQQPKVDQPIDIAAGNVDEVAPEETNAPETKDGLLEPVTWTTKITKFNEEELEVVYEAKIKEGWVVYSQFVNPDEGPLPTVIEFEEGIQKVGEASEDGEKSTGIDKVFGIEVTKFKKKLILTQRIKAIDANTPIVGYIDYMTCNDEKCIASNYDFAYQQNGLPVETASTPENEGPQAADGSRFGDPVQDCGEAISFTNLWITFIKGFLGGLVALLTPCVFPMIPLTVSFFTKQSKNKSVGLRNALIYGVSIIVIYVALGTTLTAIFGAQIMNELSTNMLLNLVFFGLFVIFAISFFGYFELTLPSSWANRTDRMADRGGFLGIFFMAFTLGIVSFSCTGPIIGTLLIESFKSQGAMVGNFNLAPPVGMLGFSTALALPFTLFAAFPGWLNSLPRSGGWMVTVKVVLGFLELALALKFLSVVDMTQHWGFLRFELFLGLWILIFAGLALYLLGLIKFPHDPPKPKIGIPRAALGVLSLAFAAYMTFGLINYKSLPILSGLAPPAHYNFFNPSDCPLGIDCYKDYDEALVESQKTGKPMFIDFTGYGCVNCRKMEEFVWPKNQILRKLTDDFIVVSLYVDDRTKLEEPYISTFDGAKKRTIGNKWADFQAIHFGANSQPYYVLVSPDEKLLNIPVGYTPNVDEFDYFLECGLSAFEQLGEHLSETK